MTPENWILEFFDPRIGKWGTFLLDSLDYDHCFKRMMERVRYEDVLGKQHGQRLFQWRMRELTTNEIIPGELLA